MNKEDKLNIRAYDILIEHIFEYETKLDNAKSDKEKRFIKKRIEVYEYLFKLIGGEIRDTL